MVCNLYNASQQKLVTRFINAVAGMTGEMNAENFKSLFIFTCMSVSVCVPHCVPGALRGQVSALD